MAPLNSDLAILDTGQLPSAGIENEQAAVGVFQYIGEMKIHVAGDEEVFIVRVVGGVITVQDAVLNAMRIKLPTEEGALIFGAACVATAKKTG